MRHGGGTIAQPTQAHGHTRELGRHHGGARGRLEGDAGLRVVVHRRPEGGGDLRVGTLERDQQVVRVHRHDGEALRLQVGHHLGHDGRRLAELGGELGGRQELAVAGALRIGDVVDQRVERGGIAQGQAERQRANFAGRCGAQIDRHGLGSGHRQCQGLRCGDSQGERSSQGKRRSGDGRALAKLDFSHEIQLFCLKRRWIEPGRIRGTDSPQSGIATAT